jgi:hypothetical protein
MGMVGDSVTSFGVDFDDVDQPMLGVVPSSPFSGIGVPRLSMGLIQDLDFCCEVGTTPFPSSTFAEGEEVSSVPDPEGFGEDSIGCEQASVGEASIGRVFGSNSDVVVDSGASTSTTPTISTGRMAMGIFNFLTHCRPDVVSMVPSTANVGVSPSPSETSPPPTEPGDTEETDFRELGRGF